MSIINTETMDGEISSSTGTLGEAERQDNRWYSNSRAVTEVGIIGPDFEQIRRRGYDHSGDITRVVRRGIVSTSVLQEIREGDLSGSLEAAVSLSQYGLGGYLVYLAVNDERRTPATNLGVIAHETEDSTEFDFRGADMARFIDITEGRGLRLSSVVSDSSGLLDIWGGVFEWDAQQIDNFTDQTSSNNDPGSLPSIWFSGLYDGATLVSAAMAERLTLPGINNEQVNLIESTEWATRPEYRGQGYMSAVLTHLNAQIIGDYNPTDIAPVIYAEANTASRADRAGNQAGFVIPDRGLAHQILQQNVEVEDDTRSKGLRDFSFMTVPQQVATNTYNPDVIDTILLRTERTTR